MASNVLSPPVVIQRLSAFIVRNYLILCLILLAVGPYINTLPNGFVYDDTGQILENPYIRSFRYLPQIFGSSVWSFTGEPSRYYRPMMTFGYLVCYQLFGLSPEAFHAFSILLNAAVVVLLFFLTKRIFQDEYLAWISATLFALHPIHTESVAWIAAVTDLELAFFYLLTFWFFLALQGKSGVRLGLVHLAMAGSFALALLFKEQATTLPLLATAYEHFYRTDRRATNWRTKFIRYIPLWLLAAAYIPLRLHSLGGFVVTSNYWDMKWREVSLSAMSLTGQYLWKLFWPVQLCAFYVFDHVKSMFETGVWVGGLCLIAMCALCWLLWRRERLPSFGLVWLMVPLLPVLNPRWLGANVFAERYLYLPSVGFCWVVAWGLRSLWRSWSDRRFIWRLGLITGLGVVSLFWMARIIVRNRDWHDDVTLYTRTLEFSPNAGIIQANLAAAYETQGLIQEAEREHRSVLERDPDCAKCMNNLAWLLISQGRHVEAKRLLTRAVALDPSYATLYLNLAVIFQKEGNLAGAEEQLNRAANLAPHNFYVYTTLGSFYEKKGDHPRAEAAFQRALAINPFSVQARNALANLYLANQRQPDALRAFQPILQQEPTNVDAITALARLRGVQHQ